MSDGTIHALPAKLDLSSVVVLLEALRGCQGSDLVLDAGKVTHLGTPGLQVLLSAQRTWSADGLSLRLDPVSPAMEEQLSHFGLDLDALSNESAPTPTEESRAPPASADLLDLQTPGLDLAVPAESN